MAASGCAVGAAGREDEALAWVEPAWMASFRQDMEEWQLEQMACFAERGVTVTPAASGGVHLPIVNLIADPPGTQDLIDEAMWDCSELVGRFDWWQVPLDEDVYQRILESRECVIAHGYEVPEA
ncbi:MAG: hypothetical protein FWG11_03490, partial [Promicromonosporaceae bacterium]|nr:hypothetical protein [Promicromonosporaceae bacterium]